MLSWAQVATAVRTLTGPRFPPMEISTEVVPSRHHARLPGTGVRRPFKTALHTARSVTDRPVDARAWLWRVKAISWRKGAGGGMAKPSGSPGGNPADKRPWVG